MIKSENGMVSISGSGAEIKVDLECAIIGLFDLTRKEYSTGFAFEVVEKTIVRALEEINKKIEEGEEKDGD